MIFFFGKGNRTNSVNYCMPLISELKLSLLLLELVLLSSAFSGRLCPYAVTLGERNMERDDELGTVSSEPAAVTSFQGDRGKKRKGSGKNCGR